jgi:hypothetical protein
MLLPHYSLLVIVRNGIALAMVRPGECRFGCILCWCRCKVVFNEQHQHTNMFAIKKEKVKEGGGAEAPPACKEKVVVLML